MSGYFAYNSSHPAILALHLRSTAEEVDKALKLAAGNESYWIYARDNHFERHVLKDIVTIDQLKAFIALLNADRYAMEGNKKYTCQKTWGLLHTDWEKEKINFKYLTAADYLSSIRRIHCCCHQVGSFALSSRYHEAVKKRKV